MTATPWDAQTYDQTSEPQQGWAAEVVSRLADIAPDSTILDVGCGSGRVTEVLMDLVPQGRVLAIDASPEMVALAQARLDGRVEIRCQDVLEIDLDEEVDAVFSTATLHWVTDHDRLWTRLAGALRPGGTLEVQCGGLGNLSKVREVIDAVGNELAPELLGGWSPWLFASPADTEQRLKRAGFSEIRCWLEERPTYPEDLEAFVRTSILAAHLERLPVELREIFASEVVAEIQPPLDYVRLNVSAVRGGA